jgi:hypothetical protein
MAAEGKTVVVAAMVESTKTDCLMAASLQCPSEEYYYLLSREHSG